ncbi:MAG: GH32 C-terminal domain-containing protein, partial [Clostridiales bacterium]|nr:GH32 C-terminal domain-containing protein [Clostridiales bacterium]
VLTNMGGNTMYFLKSKNLVEWEHAGCYEVFRPECPDLITLNDGTRNRTVITFTSRYYVICDLVYENGNIVMKDDKGNTIDHLLQGNPQFRTMDYGPDSYAAQAFYIDDDSDSAYAGKHVAVNWFSGVPDGADSIESGVLQTARKVWNGGGMTIPVIYGLKGETLTVTPITVADAEFAKLKTPIVEIENSPMTDGLLSSVKSRTAEITAKLSNPSRTGVSFKVNMSADGSKYTEIGWNKTEGYFVDRTHTDDGGIIFPQPNYARRHASGLGKDNTDLDFYILVDRNNVEVYCDGFSVPFYLLTFASPFSENMSFTSESDLTINELMVNTIASTWREANAESTLYLSETNVELDVSLTTEKEIMVVADGELSYEITSGAGVVEIAQTAVGFTVKALTAGNAVVEVKCGERTRLVNVTVHTGVANTDMTFKPSGVVSG